MRITGANGAGKSHFAAQLGRVRPEIPVVSFDAMKLQTGWRQRPKAEIDAALTRLVRTDAWIIEGGPSLLQRAVGEADALVWLDPPGYVRAWRLARRPWTFIGTTRPELPSGNVDWPWQQYVFALRSLRNGSSFRAAILDVYRDSDGLQKWQCRNADDLRAVIRAWAEAGVKGQD